MTVLLWGHLGSAHLEKLGTVSGKANVKYLKLLKLR